MILLKFYVSNDFARCTKTDHLTILLTKQRLTPECADKKRNQKNDKND